MKYFLVLITWFAPVPPEVDVYTPTAIPLMRQEINMPKLRTCNNTIERLKKGWITAPDEFGYTMNCQINPQWKPKGQRL